MFYLNTLDLTSSPHFIDEDTQLKEVKKNFQWESLSSPRTYTP